MRLKGRNLVGAQTEDLHRNPAQTKVSSIFLTGFIYLSGFYMSFNSLLVSFWFIDMSSFNLGL